MQQTNTKGFSAIPVVLAIAVIIGLTFATWYIWQNNQNDPTGKNQNKSSQDSNQPTNGQNQPKPSDPTEGGKYLVITEWGVRFPLPEGLRGDVKYGVFSYNDGSQSVYFASKQTKRQLITQLDS